uniref:Uncharacterized protein n=1 Tax=Anguilla anguilla TaxID=7936 RepID=A0A0E9SBC5_ANGAN
MKRSLSDFLSCIFVTLNGFRSLDKMKLSVHKTHFLIIIFNETSYQTPISPL